MTIGMSLSSALQSICHILVKVAACSKKGAFDLLRIRGKKVQIDYDGFDQDLNIRNAVTRFEKCLEGIYGNSMPFPLSTY